MCYIHLSIPVPFECQITCDELEKEQEDGYFEVEEDEDSDEWSRFVFGGEGSSWRLVTEDEVIHLCSHVYIYAPAGCVMNYPCINN